MSVKTAESRLAATRKKLAAAVGRWKATPLLDPRRKTRFAEVKRLELIARERRAKLEVERREARPLRLRAYDEAMKMVGVMEHGGNNRGETVEKIIRYANGTVPEAWCVDGMIWCYGHAGSKLVKPGYPRAVRFMKVTGVHSVASPAPGDLVRFNFDHTGMFVKDNGDGTITTIEFNTGPSGAVSDSSTGGDGVYRKVRSKSLVSDYLHVTE